MSYIPEDIANMIIDELQNDKYSLVRCSLVCKSFLLSCRTHLFSTVSLSYRWNGNAQQLQRYREFHKIISTTPQIASCVRHFLLYTHPRHNPSILLDEDLPDFLARLPWLRSFSFKELPQTGTVHTRRQVVTDWEIFSPTLRSALQNMFQLPTLTDLSLSAVRNIPLDMFKQYANLKSLSLSSIHGSAADSIITSLTRPSTMEVTLSKGYLRSLTASILTGFRPLFEAFADSRSLLSMDRLECFNMSPYVVDDVELGWLVVKSASHSLRCIGWDVRAGILDMQFPEVFDTDICPNLRKFCYKAADVDDWLGEQFQGVMKFMKRVSAAACGIETGELLLTFAHTNDASALENYAGWAALDAAFAHSHFTAFASLEFRLVVNPEAEEPSLATITAQFPACIAKGVQVKSRVDYRMMTGYI